MISEIISYESSNFDATQDQSLHSDGWGHFSTAANCVASGFHCSYKGTESKKMTAARTMKSSVRASPTQYAP
jgi:hypothetical protein